MPRATYSFTYLFGGQVVHAPGYVVAKLGEITGRELLTST
jgi:hypothetical protein